MLYYQNVEECDEQQVAYHVSMVRPHKAIAA